MSGITVIGNNGLLLVRINENDDFTLYLQNSLHTLFAVDMLDI